MSTGTPTAPTPTAPTPTPPPLDSDVESDTEETEAKDSNRIKIIWVGPKNEDGSIKVIDFFPDKDNAAKCKELGVEVWDGEIHRIPPDGLFGEDGKAGGRHIKMFWEAKCLRAAADAKETEAQAEKDNPDKAKDLKGFASHLAKILELKTKFEEQGIAVDGNMAKQLEALLG